MPGSRLNDTERRLLAQWSRRQNLIPGTLTSLSIEGDPGLRGIKKLEMELKYPLSVICGRNGSGKTTVLAIAALGFHTVDNHFPRGASLSTQSHRGSAYYTFRDFFFKGPTDPDIAGVSITWKYSGRDAISITKRSEKWMHYERRPARAVHYLGVVRALPAIEQSVLRSHFNSRGVFRQRIQLNEEYLRRLTEIMARPYGTATEISSWNYNLRTCGAPNRDSYSSFNMGAGEDVLIDLLGVFQSVPNGSLVIIEEIELGLHPQALSRLAEHIQEIIAQKQLQVIVSTHSREFVDSVPREARILIQPGPLEHSVLYSPTTRFAMGELTGRLEPEMFIYCEDAVASSIITCALSAHQRQRVRVVPVGDKATIATQAISHVRAGLRTRHLVMWDGDVTDAEVTGWLNNFPNRQGISYSFFPSNLAPERWVVEILNNDRGLEVLVDEFELPSLATARQLINALLAVNDPHDIPFEAATSLNLEKGPAFTILAKCAKKVDPTLFNEVKDRVEQALNGILLRGRT